MKLYDYFYKNDVGNDYIVGDIHGCYDHLERELKKVKFDESKDRLFSVGDLIDRGPDNIKCLELIQNKWFFSVKGNHEDMFVRGINGQIRYLRCWLNNGGGWLSDETAEMDSDYVSALIDKAEQLPIFIEIDAGDFRVGICHAVPPENWSDITDKEKFFSAGYEIENFIWHRPNYKRETVVGGIDYTVHGHTPTKKPVAVTNSLYIDTGVCFGRGYLTLIKVSDIPDLISKYKVYW